ncbi:tethering complex subunit [Knufia fluminis]|uniref:Tethering complex subunit n=1 Tax=Knufia fluminis TaxID=191047 RepID=A0AAN8INS8_9EURO|nr:tethering complex subunit [Knufia fluminis]
MALNTDNDILASQAATNAADALPIFNVERVQLNFNIASDFVAGQVANNVLILALATNRILRIDLENPSDIDDVDLPQPASKIGLIRRMFLDPTASHLIVNTTLGENFYLHSQSKQPKSLARFKNVSIECVAWNSSQPTASTREILVGAADGGVWEAYIEPSTEFYRREERYVTQVWRVPEGAAVTGLWVDTIPGKNDMRRVLVSSHNKVYHIVGKVGGRGREGSASIFAELFQKEEPVSHAAKDASASAPSCLAVAPDLPADAVQDENWARPFGWLSSQGILTGVLSTDPAVQSLGNKIFKDAKLHPRLIFPETMSARGGKKLIQDPIHLMTLTQWHAVALAEGRIVAVNRLTGQVVYNQTVLEPGQTALGLVSDPKKNTFWLFTSSEIFEVVATEEDRDVWKIMLQLQDYDGALKYAKGSLQRDSVAMASGDHLSSKGQWTEAASVWGRSSKAFEEVCLSLIDSGQDDALRKYLLTKMSAYKKSSIMQRVMISTWLIQIYMAKLNSLDDMVATNAELMDNTDTRGAKDELEKIRREYQDFVTRQKSDLDAKTVYEVVSSHDREEELLYFANTITDYEYVLSYWIQREKWNDALNVLNKQSNPETFYRYSNVLMTHAPVGLVEILTRRSNIEPQKMIPALLSYNETALTNNTPLKDNQAIRYLNFIVNNYPDVPASVHNTLISFLATQSGTSETTLLAYLESQPTPPLFDADFALRLCTQHHRIQSAIHIYSVILNQPLSAVSLALENNDIDLAALVADRVEPTPTNRQPRKHLWLMIAERKIKQRGTSIKSAIEFLKRSPSSSDLLKIEDLIQFFPDFVVIDDFKEEICSALESYSRHIDSLKSEMDASETTAKAIREEISALDSRYAIVEPGERCWICTLPVLSRQFFVFPCQHAFHSDCLGKRVLESSNAVRRKNIKDLQGKVSAGMGVGVQRQKWIRELDGIVGEQCVLCGDLGIRGVDEPFVREGEDRGEWVI